MKLIIDDACYAYETIFSQFGEIVAMAGRDINAESVKDGDILIVRSRTQVNEQLHSRSPLMIVVR